MHILNHQGKYLKSRGPLNIARPIQGWPVIVQAGASNAGRQLAAETAEVRAGNRGSALQDDREAQTDDLECMRTEQIVTGH